MFITVNDTEYAVDFEYDRKVPSAQLTHCTLGLVTAHVKDEQGRTGKVEYTVIGHGTAQCHPKTKVNRADTFKKPTGRKIAFQRALVSAGIDKEHRKAFFEKYFEQARK